MKTLPIKCAFFLLAVMMIGFTACSDDDNDYSAEQLEYFNKNREYIREKKALKGEDGELLYRQIVAAGDTVLYRILNKEGAGDSIRIDSKAHMMLKGDLIDGRNIQSEMEMTYMPGQLIGGLCLVMIETCVGEEIEALIPASLGYGYDDYDRIPGGSTLIFTYTIDSIK